MSRCDNWSHFFTVNNKVRILSHTAAKLFIMEGKRREAEDLHNLHQNVRVGLLVEMNNV